MGKADYESVCDKMRLANGTLWTMPITLDVSKEFAEKLKPGDVRRPPRCRRRDARRHPRRRHLGSRPRAKEAEQVFGTTDTTHPAVNYLMNQSKPVYIGGTVECLQLPLHYDYKSLRHTPAQLREEFAKRGWRKIVAFQTRNPMHRAHHELTLRAAKEEEANLLVHPVVGMTKPGDVDHYTRVRCYQALMSHYPQNTAYLSLLPLAMRMGGPREAIWHAIIRKNHGCTHLVVGRDHAGPGKDNTGKPFYGPYDAQELMQKHEEELGVKMVDFKQMVFVADEDKYYPVDEVPQGQEDARHQRHRAPRPPRPRHRYPQLVLVPRSRERTPPQPPGPRQARLHRVLHRPQRLRQKHDRQRAALEAARARRPPDHDPRRRPRPQEPLERARLLEGAPRHQHPPHRLRGRRRSPSTAASPSAPRSRRTTTSRKDVRAMIAPHGGFILVHVNTSVEECEKRDRKGLYAKARAGIIKEFTGISDPYDVPADAEVVIDTLKLSRRRSRPGNLPAAGKRRLHRRG